VSRQQVSSFAFVVSWAHAPLGAAFQPLPTGSPWVLTNDNGDGVSSLEWEVQEAGTTLVSTNAPCGAANLSHVIGGVGLNTKFRPAGNARVSCLIKACSGDGAGLTFGFLDARNFFYFAKRADSTAANGQWCVVRACGRRCPC
jgi:hypothetical protein